MNKGSIKIIIEAAELTNALLKVAEALTQHNVVLFSEKERKVGGEVMPKQLDKENDTKEVITLEEIRASLASKTRSGKQEQVKQLIKKYGANKLTDLDKGCYPDLLKEAEAL